MELRGFDVPSFAKNLWITQKHLKALESDGHKIGLHSHSHPTAIHQLPKKAQKKEFSVNYEILSAVLTEPINTMSHPCGMYNADTLEVLKSLGIVVGFVADFSMPEGFSSLEIPREDHANIIKDLKQ